MGKLVMSRIAVGLGVLLGAAIGMAHAQSSYPSKPLRLVVPYAAGGGTDLLGRWAGEYVGARLGQPVLIDNRPGASTIIGAEIVAKSPADGYTLLLTTGTAVSINPHFFRKLPYNAERDFVAVAKLAWNPYVLFAHPAQPFNNPKELIAHAKAHPGKLNIGLAGVGTPLDFATRALMLEAGIELTPVQYKGSALGINELVAGQIQLVLDSPLIGVPLVKAGRLKAVAVTSKSRFPSMPDVQALAELYPGFDASSWFGIVAPTGVPKNIISLLNAQFQRFTADPSYRERIGAQGMTLESGPPESFEAYIRAERDRWGRVVKQLNIQPQ